MHICPQCHVASIPARHAFVVMPTLETPITCSNCGAQLKLRRSLIDVLAHLPIGVTTILGMQFEVPIGFFMWSLFLAAVAGVAIWANFVRYKVVDVAPAFRPHPSTPPRC